MQTFHTLTDVRSNRVGPVSIVCCPAYGESSLQCSSYTRRGLDRMVQLQPALWSKTVFASRLPFSPCSVSLLQIMNNRPEKQPKKLKTAFLVQPNNP